MALFDFDGTITSKDTLIEFIRFSVGEYRFLKGMALLSPMLLTFKLKLIPNNIAKQKMLSYFFKGMKKGIFFALARKYSLHHIDEITRPAALECIQWHKEQGHDIVVVSASIECWLKPWCDSYDINLISTKLEIDNGLISGRFSTKNCHGEEKVNRIKELYNLTDYNQIFAYGDSSGDKELLALTDKSFYQPFQEDFR